MLPPALLARSLLLLTWAAVSLGVTEIAPRAEGQDLAESIVTARTPADRDILLARIPREQAAEVARDLLRAAAPLEAKSDFAAARAAYGAAEHLATAAGDPEALALALRGLGYLDRQEGDYPSALGRLDRSLDLLRRAHAEAEVPEALRHLGIVQRLKGDYDTALQSFAEAARLAEARNDSRSLARTLNSLAQVYSLRGESALAIETYGRAIRLDEELQDRSALATALNNLGLVHHRLGDYAKALVLLQRSLTTREALGDRAGAADTLNNLGLVHRRLGNHPLALDDHRRALALDEALGRRADVASVLNNMAVVQGRMGDLEGARASLERGLEAARSVGRPAVEAALLHNRGDLRRRQGDLRGARDDYRGQAELAASLGDRPGRAEGLLAMAELHGEQGEEGESLRLAIEAGSLAAQLGLKETQWRAYLAAARAQRRLGDPFAAQASLDEAIAVVEDLRDRLPGEENLRERFLESRTAPFREQAALLIAAGRVGDALAHAERSHARALLDVLQSGRVVISSAMTADERANEERLRAQVATAGTRLEQERQRAHPDAAMVERLERAQGTARHDLESFRAQLYAAHPELPVQRGEMPHMTADALARLDRSTTFLEYLATETETYVWVIRPGPTEGSALTLRTIPVGRAALAERIGRFRGQLAARDLGFKRLARELYDLLLGPVAPRLGRGSPLVIVPDGPLWELPFQALQRDGQRLLLDDHSLAYAPSLTALVEMRKARRPAASAAALFALAGSRAGNASSSAGEALGPDGGLEMRRQVEGLAGLYGQAASRVYVGTRATEDRLRDEAGRYAIVHFAAHGFFDDQNPLYSHLRLATSGHGDTPSSDGRLEAWEILEMGLPVRLAVLSACESGRSASGEGDGLLGLTWALFVAGCPATVVSQWNVDAASTTELMLEFHRRLRRGVSPAEALRRSALALRASPRYGHPFYWAPFMVVGDGGAAVLGGAPRISPARLRRPSGPLRAKVLEEPARR